MRKEHERGINFGLGGISKGKVGWPTSMEGIRMGKAVIKLRDRTTEEFQPERYIVHEL